ncbi:MAG: antibiotic biosynthesis monooxygenase [Pseudomonadota bacterium]
MSEPVTVVVRRRVRPGREADYEAWLKRMTDGAAANFPGYLGVGFHRPKEQGGEYRSVFRFDTLDDLEEFERSEYRESMLAEGAEFFAADAAWDRLTGLEFWFDPPSGTKVPQPNPHRMAMVMICVVFTLFMTVNAGLGQVTSGLPHPLRVFVIVVIQVSLMTYVIMPRLTPLIARFIYPKSKTL